MPGLTGFQVLERLDRNIPVIFTTAYDRYAPECLRRQFGRLSAETDRPRPPDPGARTRSSASPVRGPTSRTLARELASELSPAPRLERLASRVGERTTILDVARISHFFAQDKLTFAVSAGRDHVIDLTLADLETRLDARRFVRIHRATIVNLAFVAELYPGVDGVLARLKDDKKTELSVARDRVRALKQRLGI
jgi:two-component system LytT family response regulator